MFELLLVATIGISQILTVSSAAYVKTGECTDDQACQYSYSADQQHGDDTSNNIIASATVDIVCQSVGSFNGIAAKHFCMQISDAHIEGPFTEDNPTKTNENFGMLMAGWFCFIQTEDGKVVAVHHSPRESQNTVDFKRAIAAAFQANFKGTTEETESDPQSTHKAHYTHEVSTDPGIKKMHRRVDTDEIIDSSSGVGKRKIRFSKDEDIEYRDGHLRRSSGRAEVKMMKEVVIQQEGRRISEGFSATGSFTLELEQCYVPSGNMLEQRRQGIRDNMNRGLSEGNLRANNGMLKSRRMQDQDSSIRKRFPSVTRALERLHQDPDNVTIFNRLESLLELEHELGPPSGKSPALDDILSYLQTIANSQQAQDARMRSVIYALLSTEGSLKAQMVLLQTLKRMRKDREREAVILSIAMIDNARSKFVNGLKQYIGQADVASLDSLLLALGALASKAEERVQLGIAQFLITAASSDNLDTSTIILIRTMGNTGSDAVVDFLLQYVNSPVKDIQIAALGALVKFTHLEQVLDNLRQLIRSGIDEELLNQVARTLIQGRVYADLMDIDTSTISSHPVLRSLVVAALDTDDTDLVRRVSVYLRDLGGEMATTLLDQLYLRFKRGTDWDESNSDYDCVASQSSRASDVNTYQRHKAYIYGKTFGNDEINLNIGAGVFLGISNDCNNMKGFARACATANIFDYSRDLAEIEFSVVKTGSTIKGKAYAQIVGSTLLSYSGSVNAVKCFTYDKELAQKRIKLFSFSYSIYIFVGSVDASIAVYLGLDNNFDAEMCASLNLDELLTATTGIVPKFSVTIEGTASATLIELFRVGFTAEATLSYQIEPRGSGKACATSCSSGDYQTCVGVYNSWPGNEISLYAFWQSRKIEWCKFWGIPYPCGFDWGGKNKWSALSWTWNIGSSSTKALVETCYPTNSGCSASPVG